MTGPDTVHTERVIAFSRPDDHEGATNSVCVCGSRVYYGDTMACMSDGSIRHSRCAPPVSGPPAAPLPPLTDGDRAGIANELRAEATGGVPMPVAVRLQRLADRIAPLPAEPLGGDEPLVCEACNGTRYVQVGMSTLGTVQFPRMGTCPHCVSKAAL